MVEKDKVRFGKLPAWNVLNSVLLSKNMRGMLVPHYEGAEPMPCGTFILRILYLLGFVCNTHFGCYLYVVSPVLAIASNKFCSWSAVMSWVLFIHHKLKLSIMTRSFWASTECSQLLITVHFGTKIISWPSQHRQFVLFLSLPRVLIQVQAMSTKRLHLEVILSQKGFLNLRSWSIAKHFFCWIMTTLVYGMQGLYCILFYEFH